jgi:hypothetical protein
MKEKHIVICDFSLGNNIWLNFFYKKEIVLKSKDVLLTLSLYICACKKKCFEQQTYCEQILNKKLTFL